jgi:hypothetical protein
MGTWAGYSGSGDPETVRTLLGLGSRIESGEGWGVGISYAKGGEVPLLISTESSCTAQIGNPAWQGCAIGLSKLGTQFRTDANGFCHIYTTKTEQREWFASDPRLLVPLPHANPQVDTYALHRYLQTSAVPVPHTIFRGVECLARAQKRPLRRTLLAQQPKTLSDYIHRCAPANAATPIGVFIDGSVESALIAAVLASNGHAVVLFAPDDPSHPFLYMLAEALADHLNLPLRRLLFDATEAANAFVSTVLSLTQPCSDTRLPLYYLLGMRAREHVSEIWLGLSRETLPLLDPHALAPLLSRVYTLPMRLLLENTSDVSDLADADTRPTLASALPPLFDQHNLRVRVPFASLSFSSLSFSSLALTGEAFGTEVQATIQTLLPAYWADPDLRIRWDFPLGSLTTPRSPMTRLLEDLLAPRTLRQEDRFTPTSLEILREDPAALWTLATWEAFRQGLGLQ